MTIQFFTKTNPGWWAKSSIEAFTFPGGEPHVRDTRPGPTRGITPISPVQGQLAVVLHPTMEDLFTLAAWSQVVEERGEQKWVAIPYFPFARSDHEDKRPIMAQVAVEFIEEFVRPNKIVILDPHSDYVPSIFSGWDLRVITAAHLIGARIPKNTYAGIIAPDKGAVPRATAAAEALGLPVYLAGKTRDFETGKLTGFHMEDALPNEERFLIVDDICDGGGTFNGLSDAIFRERPFVNLDLWVSHGIFSQGLEALSDRFDKIYTTNSWLGPNDGGAYPPTLEVIDIYPYIYGALK